MGIMRIEDNRSSVGVAEAIADPMADHLRVYREQYREKLIELAATTRDLAVSHRPVPFKVGSAVLLAESGDTPIYTPYASHNFTPTPGKRTGGDKRCAERNALDTALLSDNKGTVVAITTVSRESSTGDPTKAHDVLHPCEECRRLMRQLVGQGSLREDSVLTSVNDSRGTGDMMVTEEATVGKILAKYADDEKEREVVAA